MITLLLAALIASQPVSADVGYEQLVAGHNDAAITRIEGRSDKETDPARLINLGIAYARSGDPERARSLFKAAYASPEWVELETATGAWVDSRVLARRALAMLDAGAFGAPALLASNSGR